jgi:hypothetical protein
MVELVRATGRAGCRTCSKTIAKDEWCIMYATGQWNSRAYIHYECLFANMTGIQKIKFELQRKAQEVHNGTNNTN